MNGGSEVTSSLPSSFRQPLANLSCSPLPLEARCDRTSGADCPQRVCGVRRDDQLAICYHTTNTSWNGASFGLGMANGSCATSDHVCTLELGRIHCWAPGFAAHSIAEVSDMVDIGCSVSRGLLCPSV